MSQTLKVEQTDAKILLKTLGSIPRSYDVAHHFYQDRQAPIFEVILPMTTSFESIDNIYHYYCDCVIGQQHKRLGGRDLTIADWIGSFYPDKIRVIPLFEDKKGMLCADSIVWKYLKDKEPGYQRVFLARSDPAVNYGQIGAVLLNKIAFWRLHVLSEKIEIPIYPILGTGSAPFRGNLRPDTVKRVTDEYAGHIPLPSSLPLSMILKKTMQSLQSGTSKNARYYRHKRSIVSMPSLLSVGTQPGTRDRFWLLPL